MNTYGLIKEEITFTRAGLTFILKDMQLKHTGKLVMSYKIIGTEDKANNKAKEDGFYGGCHFSKGGPKIYTSFTVKGKKYRGANLPDDIYKKLLNMLNELEINKNQLCIK